jgi:hypothetical protein
MRKFYRICICLIILSLFNITCYSQKDFRSGYVIDNNLDTIKGLLNNRSNRINSEKCEFKKTVKAKTIVYYPNDINSYTLSNNRHYVSKTININGEEKHVFLEFLVKGIVDLYYYNEGLEEYFYIDIDGGLVQLNNNEIEVFDENGAKHIRYTNQYKGVLQGLFGNVPELNWQIINSKFELASLINLTKEYHRMVCTDEVCIDYTKMRKLDIFCEVFFGADFSFMGLASSHDYAKDLKPIIGTNIRFKDNRYNSKINLLIGLNMSKHSFSGGFRNTLIYAHRTMSHGVDLNCTLLRIPITLEYEFLSGRFKPNLSLSFINSIFLNPEYYVEIRNYTDEDKYIANPSESPLRKFEFGVMMGLGCSYEINNNSYLNFVINGDYRVPYANFNLILDRLHFKSLLFQVGYGFRII